MRTFYLRPDAGPYMIPGLFFMVGLAEVMRPIMSGAWDGDAVARFCAGLACLGAVYLLWPRPYWVEVSERGIRRVYGAWPWGDHTSRRFALRWEELRDWYFRTEPAQGDEGGRQDWVHLLDAGGRQWRLGGFAPAIRDELRRWVPEKERPAELV